MAGRDRSVGRWKDGSFRQRDLYGQPPTFPYAYVPRSEVKPYWEMAEHYVLADRMFPTEFGSSFTAHLDLIAANTQLEPGELAEVDYPPGGDWGCEAAVGTKSEVVNAERVQSYNGPFPCFTQFRTMADTLDAAHVSWRYYAPSLGTFGGDLWSAFTAIKNVYEGPDRNNVVSPETTVLTNLKGKGFPNVVWVVPDYQNSDHAGSGSDTGPSWVASIVNAVGASLLAFLRDFRRLGRLGRVVRRRAAAATGLPGLSDSRPVHRHLALREDREPQKSRIHLPHHL